MTKISETSIDFIAGWCSGAVGVLTCQPVDTALTRYQAGVATMTQTKTFVRSNGVRALWRGSSAMIGAVPFQNALLMGGYGIGKQYAEGGDNVLTSVFVGGCVGGIVQSFLMSPVELIKVHQQVIGQSAKTASLELVRGFWNASSWRGLTATLWRDGIPHGVWFATYEYSKTTLTEAWKETPANQVTVPLVSGGIAATVAWGVGYPFDLIKTRIQASAQPQHGIIATAQELIAESNGNALTGLYRGFGWKLARAIPASMVGFITYEFVADQLRS
mmetsp:Transcript_2861/g.7917  ORF Transcript_2861/g.7917 Transcript_2861/m.7917 type:complete len:274 (-) Transcript_2861:233-1054(-)|eukprot:CAMPEP_0198134656 /NCGR_PEP_ID=MMETSP1442-20131203/60185_1 /TAXON_ID= /ORGANISM="Craspedostauros australis, Strain CCMP3328" /LENGTH=273 /DNA_ID=CAMNT_0043795801 /DNA_START=16 /DNA_END=837 /DNA_ORIENTATION=+